MALKRGHIPQQSRQGRAWAWPILFLLLAGCGPQPVPKPETALEPTQLAVPEPGELQGWAATGDVELYDHENLYSLVNGQADAFFAYGLEEVTVQRYEGSEGAELRVRIWKLPTPADAYGLYTSSGSGVPVPVGNDGRADAGRYLAFWQDQYHVELFAIPELAGQEALQELALTLSARLPPGGQRPTLLDRLPPQGLDPDSAVYFHEEISIQDYLWLGGENLLRLSPETDGVLARDDVGGDQAQLLLVQYPTEEAASALLAALESSDLALIAARAQGRLLGAVFGEIGAAAAESLLAAALGGP
jgi:hypothetical protein